MPPKVTIIDYGIGNLLSVRRGLEHWGFEVLTSDDPETILNSERVVLPGVGSFGNGMSELISRRLDVVIRKLASIEVPLLAICLGMQLLFEYGEEYGMTAGLGIIPGGVVSIPSSSEEGAILRVPHIGWNSLSALTQNSSWEETVLQDLKNGSAVYFNHSFMVVPDEDSDLKAVSSYGGHSVSAVVQRGSVTGCQFHPEKSGEIGLTILKNFVDQ